MTLETTKPQLLILLLLVTIQVVVSREDNYPYETCTPFNCGNISNIGFPFYRSDSTSKCGLPNFELICNETTTGTGTGTEQLLMYNRSFEVKELAYKEQWIHIVDTQLLRSLSFGSTCFLPQNLEYKKNEYQQLSPQNDYLVFLSCPPRMITVGLNFIMDCTTFDLYFTTTSSYTTSRVDHEECFAHTWFPVLKSSVSNNTHNNLTHIIADGFLLEWSSPCTKCELRGGKCGYDPSNATTICFCKDGLQYEQCYPENVSTVSKLIAVGIASMIVLAAFLLRKKCLRQKIKMDVHSQGTECFLEDYSSLVPKRYSFMDIKKMTDHFREKIGQGGCGSVFKGRLPNGVLVAVKIIYKSSYCREGFMNEVATVGHVHHVNVIRFLGFCCEGPERALVYEFMPNGSLDKFIYNKELARTQLLGGWQKMFDIAVGIARGIQYLHHGCNTGILHFDIKPHNVLLDGNFIPKISDFGLAKLFSDERISVMTSAMGTLGYVAPELFSRNFGHISFKSDVYSYGMLVLEIIGRRNGNFSQVYFPSWVYNRLSRGKDLGIGGAGDKGGDEHLIVKKMAMVGLWCIQINPVERPSMCNVVRMLEEDVENLEMPPRPFLSPHPREEVQKKDRCLYSKVS